MITIRKNISDFLNGVLEGQFHVEITNNSIITATLIGVHVVDDSVHIIFDRELTSEEIEELDTLIMQHVPNLKTGFTGTLQFSLNVESFNENNYTTITPFTWMGPPIFNNINNIFVISFMQSDGVSYDLRLFDVYNHRTIAYGNFKNTNEAICELRNIENIPQGPTQLELQAKVDEHTQLTLKNLSIYFS